MSSSKPSSRGKDTENGDFYAPRPIRVFMPCTRHMIEESEVIILDIEEDIQGRDKVSFTCPECNAQHKSLRFG